MNQRLIAGSLAMTSAVEHVRLALLQMDGQLASPDRVVHRVWENILNFIEAASMAPLFAAIDSTQDSIERCSWLMATTNRSSLYPPLARIMMKMHSPTVAGSPDRPVTCPNAQFLRCCHRLRSLSRRRFLDEHCAGHHLWCGTGGALRPVACDAQESGQTAARFRCPARPWRHGRFVSRLIRSGHSCQSRLYRSAHRQRVVYQPRSTRFT